MADRIWKREYRLGAGPAEQTGKIVWCDLTSETNLMVIDIRSDRLPELDTDETVREEELRGCLIINYCSQGRCELELHNGEYTYLASGEVALDAGQARQESSAFYFPAGEYRGCEIVIRPGSVWHDGIRLGGKGVSAPEEFRRICLQYDRPRIFLAEGELERSLQQLCTDVSEDRSRDVLLLGVLRILFLLRGYPIREERRRDYYTQSQVAIAKQVMSLVSEDPAVRYTAAELAERFDISETSLKNYFRGVYGCGYSQFQKEMRMAAAGRLLREEDLSVGEISSRVGFASQSKFGSSFREYYGMTPLEYRRRCRLEEREKK